MILPLPPVCSFYSPKLTLFIPKLLFRAVTCILIRVIHFNVSFVNFKILKHMFVPSLLLLYHLLPTDYGRFPPIL